MNRFIKYLICAVVILMGTAAFADDIQPFTTFSGTGTAHSQLGRLSRNAIQQDWVGSEAYPGVINPTTTYFYQTYSFGPNSGVYAPYIQVDTSTTANVFISAYLDSYDPLNMASNWLGDIGSSGNFFGVDFQFMNIIVPQGHTLIIVANSTAGGTAGTADQYGFEVEDFSSSNYDDPIATPEPGSLALLGSGLIGIGGVIRRKLF